jgi:hypothetical protein
MSPACRVRFFALDHPLQLVGHDKRAPPFLLDDLLLDDRSQCACGGTRLSRPRNTV